MESDPKVIVVLLVTQYVHMYRCSTRYGVSVRKSGYKHPLTEHYRQQSFLRTTRDEKKFFQA